jgi:hypothetical protein
MCVPLESVSLNIPAFFQFFPNIANHWIQSCISLRISTASLLTWSAAYNKILAEVKIGKIISHDNMVRFSEYLSKIEQTLCAAETQSWRGLVGPLSFTRCGTNGLWTKMVMHHIHYSNQPTY